MIDKLTFLWVRRCYDLFYHLVIKTKGYLIFVDIDDFKKINTSLGHKGGDKVLREIGKILLKKSKGRTFRYGGDEFVILLPWANKEAAVKLAHQVRAKVEEQDTQGVTITCVVARHEEAIKDLLKKGKENGKNMVIVEQ